MKLNQYEWDPEKDWIGEGAFAEVFRARDNLDNYVALKSYTVSLAKGDNQAAFKSKYSLEAEFKKGRDLAHTNVIKYIGLDYIVHTNHMQRETNYPVLIMEYADGGSLEERIRRAYPTATDETTIIAIGIDETLTIIKEVLDGLAYMHSQDIIHRDLKPANILFKKDRKGHPVVKITDFGISRDNLASVSESATAGVGTASYMAPEQFAKKAYGLNGTISNRTDVWAVGVILYRMLTGKLPFVGGDYDEVEKAVLNTEPDYSKVPFQFQAVIKGCFQKHAANRVPDAVAVLRMLNSAPPPSPPSSSLQLRETIILMVTAIVIVAVISLGGRFGCNGHVNSSAVDSAMTADSIIKADSAAKASAPKADSAKVDTMRKDTTQKK